MTSHALGLLLLTLTLPVRYAMVYRDDFVKGTPSTIPRRMPFTAPLVDVDVERVVRQVYAHYPGALREDQFVSQLHDELQSSRCFEDGREAIVATALCCDEINRGLEAKLATRFGGSSFAMGGLAGFPFAGVTGFGAFAHHIPQNGVALIVYGPHVGVDASGVVGKVNRRGIRASGACCGAASAALDRVRSAFKTNGVLELAADLKTPTDITDTQQNWVVRALFDTGADDVMRVDDVLRASNPNARLPFALFDAQKQTMDRIIQLGAPGNVPEGTTIVVVGGIQINTPDGMGDYFLPLVYQLRTSDGSLVRVLVDDLHEKKETTL